MIASATGEASPATPAEPPRTAPLSDLAHNPFNPRTKLGDLQETADSLLEKGQIQPLTIITRQAFLNAHPDQETALGTAAFVVLDGHRRLAAARLAGVDELRVDVNDSLASPADAPRLPDQIGDDLGLLRVDQGADVLLVRAHDPVVFERAVDDDGLRRVALSQLVLDCPSGLAGCPRKAKPS